MPKKSNAVSKALDAALKKAASPSATAKRKSLDDHRSQLEEYLYEKEMSVTAVSQAASDTLKIGVNTVRKYILEVIFAECGYNEKYKSYGKKWHEKRAPKKAVKKTAKKRKS